jgi:hypothetical protein
MTAIHGRYEIPSMGLRTSSSKSKLVKSLDPTDQSEDSESFPEVRKMQESLKPINLSATFSDKAIAGVEYWIEDSEEREIIHEFLANARHRAYWQSLMAGRHSRLMFFELSCFAAMKYFGHQPLQFYMLHGMVGRTLKSFDRLSSVMSEEDKQSVELWIGQATDIMNA